MAASLLLARAAGLVSARSAGSAPADELDPAVVLMMGELGVDLSAEFPKPLTDEAVRAADVVVTMGCGPACALEPGKHHEDWAVEDPSGKSLAEVRAIRDELDRRVSRLLRTLA